MDVERGRRGRVRSFVIGGLLGASAALATARRTRPGRPRRRRETPAGLAAFESAPCYRELLEQGPTEPEAQTGRPPAERPATSAAAPPRARRRG